MAKFEPSELYSWNGWTRLDQPF